MSQTSNKRLPFRALALMVGAGALLALVSPAPAIAAGTMSATGVTSTVTGTSVTVTATITRAVAATASLAGICARTSNNRNIDFPLVSANLSSTGTTFRRTAILPVGTYRYWPCAKVGGIWTNVTTAKTFTIAVEAAGLPSTPSSVPMPVGDLPGWKQVFTEDFTTNIARGTFPGPYSGKWLSYHGFTDTSKVGDYDQSIISAQNGYLDLYLHTKNGRPVGAAPVPLVNGKWGGQVYGKFSVRMKADSVPGFGTGFLLWNDSGNWADGEIDFPESGLNDVVKGYNHCPGDPSKNCLVVNTTARYSNWHTYTIDWTPAKLTFLIDGVVVGSTTSNIPSKSLHWVMQVATTGVKPDPAASGHVLIDWATIYTYAP